MRQISYHAFKGLHNLIELHLAYNQINTLPVNAFKVFANGSLRVLDLSFNGLTGNFEDEHSFASVSTVTHLNLSYNPIETVGKWIHAFTNLQELKMNSLTSMLRIDFMEWTTPIDSLRHFSLRRPELFNILDFDRVSLAEKAPNLAILDLADTRIYEFTVIRNLSNLEYLDAYYSFGNFKYFEMSWSTNISYSGLKTLKLGYNKIKYIDKMQLNLTTPRLEYLDLTFNMIKTLQNASLETLLYLEHLKLDDNWLLSLDGILHLQKVKILQLAKNSISEIPSTFLDEINSLVTLDVSGNPFACTCAIEPFRKWILSDKTVYLYSYLGYICKTPENLAGTSVTEVKLDCSSYIELYVSIGVASGFLAVVLVSVLIKYRWHIRYRLFLLGRSCNCRKPNQPLENEGINNGMRYDCFVSFAYENDKDLNWVVSDLRKNMEEGIEPLRLCIGHARDFVPGTPLLEAVTEAIHNSRKTLVVLSPSYLESEWCYFETQHAWLRLLNEGQDVIILVLLDPIPDAKMTMWLRQFLCKKGYLKWPKDKPGQNLFFRCLRELIKKPNAVVDRRIDV
ncbi:toll-like receptor 4 [Amphiura filiformis]|uniref:toll-like receptor 4 n=1 Tax=Amphiura filiformis TaxID=82378 RepID=UPI003B21D9E9